MHSTPILWKDLFLKFLEEATLKSPPTTLKISKTLSSWCWLRIPRRDLLWEKYSKSHFWVVGFLNCLQPQSRRTNSRPLSLIGICRLRSTKKKIKISATMLETKAWARKATKSRCRDPSWILSHRARRLDSNQAPQPVPVSTASPGCNRDYQGRNHSSSYRGYRGKMSSLLQIVRIKKVVIS